MAMRRDSAVVEVPVESERAVAWPVYWGAVWVGALAAVVAALVGGLFGVAFRAYAITPGGRIGPEDLGASELAASVCVAFFSFVIGGWSAVRITGLRRAEPAMLHGAITWLLIALGARSYFGAWYGGLAGTPVWAAPGTAIAAKAAREAAGGAATALLLGLIGAVLGGWMASGEPMTYGHYRTRNR
jgi:hypothetical protein